MNPFELGRWIALLIKWGPELRKLIAEIGRSLHTCNQDQFERSTLEAVEFIIAREQAAGRARLKAERRR